MKFSSPAEVPVIPVHHPLEKGELPIALIEEIGRLRIRVASVLFAAEQICKEFAA